MTNVTQDVAGRHDLHITQEHVLKRYHLGIKNLNKNKKLHN